MAPLVFHGEERYEDDHQEETDHTENNDQATVSHQEKNNEDMI